MRALFRYLLALAALLAIWQIGSLAPATSVAASWTCWLFRDVHGHLAALQMTLAVLSASLAPVTTPGFWAMSFVDVLSPVIAPLIAPDRAAPVLMLFRARDHPRLIALTTGYQILVVTRASAQGLDKKYLDSFRSLGGTPLQMLRHVLIPAALPDAMTALKVASGTAVAVLFMAESFATRRGLGFLIMDAWGRGDQLEMFTGILAMSLLGVALYELCNVLETRSCRWRNFHMAGKR
ncbi:MAG: ABC transporter permease [Bilophila wadsworthia]